PPTKARAARPRELHAREHSNVFMTVASPLPKVVDDARFLEVRELPLVSQMEEGDLFAIALTNNTTRYTHGLHRFPAKYVPQIPAWAITNYLRPGGVVLDPFVGSGTTLVECALQRCTAVGLDIDPLARFISAAKTTAIDA